MSPIGKNNSSVKTGKASPFAKGNSKVKVVTKAVTVSPKMGAMKGKMC